MQVVLADPKDRDKDVVAFLAAEHQCSSLEETGQRVAVTALHRVAGDRALHRVLPEMYRPLWHQLSEHVSCNLPFLGCAGHTLRRRQPLFTSCSTCIVGTHTTERDNIVKASVECVPS